jgi:ketosteroid isomerase-like protein
MRRTGPGPGVVQKVAGAGPRPPRLRVPRPCGNVVRIQEEDDGVMDARQRTQMIMDAMADGNLRPLFDTMCDDVTWRWMGVTSWSKTFHGKQEVVGELFGGAADALTDSFGVQLLHVLADGDHVVVEHTGRSATPAGRPYENNYCWVLTFRDDLIHEVREYMDTQLVTETFADAPS